MIQKKMVPALVCGAVVACAGSATVHEPIEDEHSVRVELCDGETAVMVTSETRSREEGQAIASRLMATWQAKNPERAWEMPQQEPQDPIPNEATLRERFLLQEPFDNRVLLGEGQKDGHPYKNFAPRDIVLWEREIMDLVIEGAQVFHDAERLGSTIGVSCDMCHPDASNTHPETYPKYQTQLGKTVLLRHMINWCIEHPLRGEPLAHDDPRMIAMEAYILAQRKGEVLKFGKH